MRVNKTAFDWIDDFDVLTNVYSNIYVNDELKIQNILLNKISINRNSIDKLIMKLNSNTQIWNIMVSGLEHTYGTKIRLQFTGATFSEYKEIILYDAQCIQENINVVTNNVEFAVEMNKIEYLSNTEGEILKEWYGCHNKLRFHDGILSYKKYEEITTYKYGNRKTFQLKNGMESHNSNSFWIKLKDYKFKVSIDDIKNEEKIYHNYSIEYRNEWGLIPNENIRKDISRFLSFIIGTKLVKFAETEFDSSYIVRKQYISPSVLERSSLFETNFEFYCTDYRKNDTDIIIKHIPKMLNNYFKLKDEFRLNEVFASLYVHSYLNFNFINYVTYIEMFSNINQKEEKLQTVIPKQEFKKVLKKLNSIEEISKKIKDKFYNLNTIGIGKKVQRLLLKYKIDYNRYKDVFSTRGEVVHGKYVEIEDMHIASQKAKELLTILTLKKLHYSGYIRNFTNNDELILIKDFSIIHI